MLEAGVMPDAPVASIVIRCLNEEAHIGRLLDGIIQQSVTDVEIIVVDSGSTDTTLDIVGKYPAKILHIKPEDFSFGRSLNLGCQAATGDFIVIASAHVYPVYRDWLEKLLAPFSDPQVALSYGKQHGTDASKYSERRVLAKWFPDKANLRQTGPFCNNANAAIRTSLWKSLPYDETLTGVEDTDWASRAGSLGHVLAYVADATVVHNHNESPRQIHNRYKREAIALKRIFPHEHLRFWDAGRLFVANVLSDYYHAARDRAFWRNVASIPVFRLMQFTGAYRGFALRGPVTSRLKRTFYYPTGPSRRHGHEDPAAAARLIDYSESAQDDRQATRAD
ncbi:MAG: glycosyltransferase family 2 protein [Proteobacteria bacterium]|nr:glycosyltransferase family 2 protein [Pseudomonadota bacterium]